MNKLMPLFLTILVVFGCSKMNKFEKNTSKLDKTTTQMSYTAEEIKLIANSIFPQIRSGDTIRTRNEAWDNLTNPQKGQGEKFLSAGIFFQALEYQLWTASAADNPTVLDYMYRDAADEFQARMYDLYREVDLDHMSPLKEGKRNNAEMAFYALAMTMDRSHHFQRELKKRIPHLDLVSFLEIIENSLLNEKSNRSLKEHEIILLSGINKEIILELYQARVDIYAALALKDLVDQREMSISHYSRAAVFMITGGRWGSVEVPETFRQSNEPTRISIVNYLNNAISAKNFLERVGVEYKMEKTLKSALKAIEMKVDADNRAAEKSKEQIQSLIKALI